MTKEEIKIEDAASQLHITVADLKARMRQGKINIGTYIIREGRRVGRYHVDPVKLDRELKRRKGFNQPNLLDKVEVPLLKIGQKNYIRGIPDQEIKGWVSEALAALDDLRVFLKFEGGDPD